MNRYKKDILTTKKITYRKKNISVDERVDNFNKVKRP